MIVSDYQPVVDNVVAVGERPDGSAAMLPVSASGGLQLSGLKTPLHDQATIARHGTTNNINTITYRLSGSVVGTLTISYVVGTPTTNNALISGYQIV